MAKFKSIPLQILKYLFLLMILLVSLGPLLWVFLSSFKSNAEIARAALSLPESWSLINYLKAFQLAPIVRFYANSVVVSVFGTLFNLLILGLCAYAVVRFSFRGKRGIMLLVSFALLIPSAALLQPLFLTVKTLGLYDSLAGLILVNTGFGIPITFYILYSYFHTIPMELEESAYMDGSGVYRTAFQIILPVARPGFATAAVLQFLRCWNEFQFALVLTTGNQSRTLPIALYYFKSQFATDYGVMFAATIVIIIPSVLAYVLLEKQVISGLVAGAVKG